MTTAIATTNGAAVPAHAATIDPAMLERVVCDGDLSRLTPAQKVQWYRARCEAAGLDPRTQPFQYVNLSGKLVLYATKTATDQLIAKHGITVRILSRQFDPESGIYEVHCSAAFPDGRTAEDIGALFIGKANGEALANAIMKAVTKGKRRTVLSACGLGMLDESEVDSIPGAQRFGQDSLPAPDAHHAKHFDNGTGHGSGAYAAPADVDAYRAWLKGYTDRVNGAWLDRHTDGGGEVAAGVAELVNPWQLSAHLLKFLRSLPDGDPARVNAPDEARTRQVDPMVSVAFARDPAAVKAEAKAYCARLAAEAEARLAPPEPEDVPDAEYGDDPYGDPDGDLDIPGERVPGEDG
jgi:hypothetical protein